MLYMREKLQSKQQIVSGATCHIFLILGALEMLSLDQDAKIDVSISELFQKT